MPSGTPLRSVPTVYLATHRTRELHKLFSTLTRRPDRTPCAHHACRIARLAEPMTYSGDRQRVGLYPSLKVILWTNGLRSSPRTHRGSSCEFFRSTSLYLKKTAVIWFRVAVSSLGLMSISLTVKSWSSEAVASSPCLSRYFLSTFSDSRHLFGKRGWCLLAITSRVWHHCSQLLLHPLRMSLSGIVSAARRVTGRCCRYLRSVGVTASASVFAQGGGNRLPMSLAHTAGRLQGSG